MAEPGTFKQEALGCQPREAGSDPDSGSHREAMLRERPASVRQLLIVLVLAEPVKDQKLGSDGAEWWLRKRLFIWVMSSWFRKGAGPPARVEPGNMVEPPFKEGDIKKQPEGDCLVGGRSQGRLCGSQNQIG